MTDRAPDLLALVSDVAARLAGAGDIVARTADVLSLVRQRLDADEVDLWLHGAAGGLVRSLHAGAPDLPAGAVEALLVEGTPTAEGAVVHPLAVGTRRIGALALRRAARLIPDEASAFAATAAMLAPQLLHAERVRQLERELERRTGMLDEERHFTDLIVDSLPVGLYVIDREYRVRAWNRTREIGLQGVSRQEAMGRTIFEILHRASADALRHEFDEVFATGRVQQFTMESEADGATRAYRITKVPMRLKGPDVSHVITIGEDVSEWTSAHQKFAQAEKLAAIGQLAAGVMHEVNNPLATIGACADSLELRMDDLVQAGVVLPAQTREFLQLIGQEVERCKRIVDGLLGYSRPRDGRFDEVAVHDVVERSLFLVRHHPRIRKLQLTSVLDRTLPLVHANAEQLLQVVMSLVINAADAMDATGTITVRTRPGMAEREEVVLEVIDTGHGIAESDLPRIFDPFYTTKAPGRGTGLGLAICYGIVSDHRGRIEVDSEVGLGSTFRILLPAAR